MNVKCFYLAQNCLVKEFKKPLLDMLDLQEVHQRSERSEHREPSFKVFSREKEHTDDGYTSFSENKVKTNVHKVHYVHSSSSGGLKSIFTMFTPRKNTNSAS